MDEGYVLEWLDTLITVTLNPTKTKIRAIVPEEVTKIRDQVIFQKNRVQSVIKSTVFSLNDEAKIKCLIKKYHSSLITLLDQALEDQATVLNANLKRVLGTIVSSIDELLYLIERRFKGYMSIEEPVPVTYLTIIEKEVSKRLSELSKKFQDHLPFQPAFGVLTQELESFLNYPSNRHSCTFQEMFYIRELCRELEYLEPSDEPGIYTSLDELLISINFNSSTYIKGFIQRIAAHINEQTREKMGKLLFYQKLFRQLHRRPDMIFNVKDAGVFQQIDNWFSQEIFYLEKQSHFSITPLKAGMPNRITKNKEKQKIVSNLSVDQMALILRAADDLKIIIAHSLNSVFKSMVPHLSTPNQENISYDSMRSKSYSAELRDKEIVIETLQQMIKKIKEY